jgi:hypothetical protein
LTNKFAFAFFAAALTSTVALAQSGALTGSGKPMAAPAPVASPTDMQAAVLRARIDAESTDIFNYESAIQANRGLLAKDTAALAELCRVAPRPAGCAKK